MTPPGLVGIIDLPQKSTVPFFRVFVNPEHRGSRSLRKKLINFYHSLQSHSGSRFLYCYSSEKPQVPQLLQITSVGSKLLRLHGVKVTVFAIKASLYILSLDYPQQLSHFVDDYERCTYWQPQDCVNMATLRLIGWWRGVQSPRKLRRHSLTYSDSTPSLSCPTVQLMKLN